MLVKTVLMKECFWRRNEFSEVTVKGVLVKVFWSSNYFLKNMNEEGLRKGLFGVKEVLESFGSIGEELTKKFLVTEFLKLSFRSIGGEGFGEGFLGVFGVVMNFRKRVLGRYFLDLS